MVSIPRPSHTFVTWESLLGPPGTSWEGSSGENPRGNRCVAKLKKLGMTLRFRAPLGGPPGASCGILGELKLSEFDGPATRS